MDFITKYESPIGWLTLASDGDGLVGVWVAGQKYYAQTLSQRFEERDDLPLFSLVKKWLDRYFAGERVGIDSLPLAPRGSDFRKEVWGILRRIPYGEVTTYARIAREVARARGIASMSCQAVGGAVGHNPISVIIPCHRVVGSDGGLTGFASGLAVKRRLLELEGGLCSVAAQCEL